MIQADIKWVMDTLTLKMENKRGDIRAAFRLQARYYYYRVCELVRSS